MKKAVVIGGTGATGRQLVRQLLSSVDFQTVTSIGRRPALNGNRHEKLNDVVIHSMSQLHETKDFWNENDIFFNCIGTTRKKAGSAKQFVDIELGISRLAAKMASEANIPQASVISAGGANHKAWSVDWIHPLLYTKTIGQKEQTLIAENKFKRVSIFRPGMLIRSMEESKLFDNILTSLGLGLQVEILAKGMIIDALRFSESNDSKKINYIEGNHAIIELTK